MISTRLRITAAVLVFAGVVLAYASHAPSQAAAAGNSLADLGSRSLNVKYYADPLSTSENWWACDGWGDLTYVKSSNKNVLTVKRYYNDFEPTEPGQDKHSTMFVLLKNPGKAKVTYVFDGVKHSLNVTVKNASGKSEKNIKAYQAYSKVINKLCDKGYKYWGYSLFEGVKYKMVDLNGDGVDEMLAYSKDDTVSDCKIYAYRSGKAKKVFGGDLSLGDFPKYYKKTGVVTYTNSRTGTAELIHLKWNGKKMKKVAIKYYPFGGYSFKTRYKVHGKSASKAKYKSVVKKATKGKKGTKLNKGKWKTVIYGVGVSVG